MEMLHDNAAKKTKRLTSIVWNHFERVKKADAQYAICLHCKKKLSGSSNSGTTHLRNHLLRCLKRSNYDVSHILSAKRKRKDTIQSPLRSNNIGIPAIGYGDGRIKDEILSPTPLRFDLEHRRDEVCKSINLGSVKFDQGRSRLDLARMIMLHSYPLAMVDHVGFQVFVKNLQPLFEVKDYGAVELDCLTIFSNEKQKLYSTLDRLHGRINLSVDVWSSPEGSGHICLVANYIDEDWRLQKKMLNFLAMDPSSTDDTLSEVFVNSLTDWGVDGKLFSTTFDDCGVNELLLFKIKDLLSRSKHISGELFDVRCIAHLMKSIALEISESNEEVICKIRDGIGYVKSSQALLSKFRDEADQMGIDSSKCLVHDFPARWDSTGVMLHAAIEYKAAFSLLQEHDSSYTKAVSETEWEQATAVAGCIKLLADFTNIFVEKKHPTANIFFPEICDLHIQLMEWCKSPDDSLSSLSLKMKRKFDVYWNKCSLVLAIAAALDPRFKMKLVEYYFQEIYGDAATEHVQEVYAGLRQLFGEYSKAPGFRDHDSSIPGDGSGDKLRGFDRFLLESSQSHSTACDLDKYLEEPVFPRSSEFNVLNWWKVHTPRYPVLSMVAHDVLAAQVSTLRSEVAFSKTGRVLDRSYSSLNPDTREALLCGQDWLRVEPEEGQLSLSSSVLPVRMETS